MEWPAWKVYGRLGSINEYIVSHGLARINLSGTITPANSLQKLYSIKGK